ncbi:MAG: cysteine-rich KTR domain-containing protein [Fusicatenibacter saccharivorans]
MLCPICNNKTRIKIRKDTQLIHFPLFCPKCKNESLVDYKKWSYYSYQRARR